MLRSYITIACRNLVRYKGYTFINVFGLAIAIACCLVIFLFVQDELRFDRFHAKAKQIHRIINHRSSDGVQMVMARTPPAYGPALERTFPEVLQSTRIFGFGNKELVAYGNRKFFETGILLADSTFFEMFSFPLTRGNANQVLNSPDAIVISETMAEKYFGNQDPLGKQLVLDGSYKFRVTGIMRDMPAQSHLKASFIGSFDALREIVSAERLQSWGWQQFYTYITLSEGSDPAKLNAKLPAFLAQHAKEEASQQNSRDHYQLQALTDIHLRSSDIEYDIVEKGNIQYIYAFSLVAVFTLLIACFNFMNLSTARSARRAREVGMRKAIGAQRIQLIGQFLGESILQTGMALVLAILLTAIVIPTLNNWTGKTLLLSSLSTFPFLLGLFGFTLLIGLLAGSYPAFFLSGFKPLHVLKGMVITGNSATFLRRNLVVVQFVVSIMLMIGAGVVFFQVRYIQEKNLGFSNEQLITMPIRNTTMLQNIETIKAELRQNPSILNATACYGVPGGQFAGDGIVIPGRTEEFSTNMFLVDEDYIPTLGMTMAAGRNFSKSFGNDAREAFILNETAVRELGWGKPESAIGKTVNWRQWQPATPADSIKRGKVIGVVKDFNYKTIHQKIEPMVLQIVPAEFSQVVVRIRPEASRSALAMLAEKWKAAASEWPFEYTFLDEQFAAQYKSEQIFSKVFGLFTFLSIFITCLGLFGLAAFTAEQRTKEIGVRKVLGASVASIVALLSKDFLMLVLIALVIASPVAWYAMNYWLEAFAYRIEIQWWMFVLAGSLAIAIAFFTVFFQSVKAALLNPVKSLRSE
ncbi:ABC transporter permease [Dyadobacter sediminis]|uniref:FtsX-like permease family protein n=1 Tax=Dyadobacter sediminis TaxID=1493691 RepID=A0A5R9KFE0_9BACT|nr:ABC transporter permease [Dyadobacter sediminis]TLU94824.1 FtsX-like permease family protein [Dyadobacter sediminis]GGB87648.1 ABC transporter permease [Dyadobacter sediminis]